MADVFLPQNQHLAIRTIAMPRDTNPGGDIFGGWLVSQMDLAAGTVASIKAEGRVVTVAIDGLTFHKPVFVGDEVSCYAEIIKIGRTSTTIKVEAWVRRKLTTTTMKVTEGIFTFVAIDGDHTPRAIQKN
ncbi:acyl-CoA thioesterase [Candidatus Odyssella acanthamoebae]|uniref:Acyl-CoA thioester hydrolase n=1 Tax=Candidatus Odyssella acanthamoebae TaxID=91604 RepID=A0A077AT56_9PROT|nr:acyl-CoA thioesterase [Candidatus Paracaedibacter acanthamoebae]AIK96387.1 acyl-CoA thioester hydrolase [Candidatus Paracaedibacter acanthamoebae]